MSVFDKGFITVCVCCAVFAVISLPLIFRKVPRNPVYGYRTRATLQDDALWYDANAYFGRWFIAASVLTSAIAVVIDMWRGISPEAYLKVSILLLCAPVLIAVILTQRFIRAWKTNNEFPIKRH
jgi:uncharacterized membrane protein